MHLCILWCLDTKIQQGLYQEKKNIYIYTKPELWFTIRKSINVIYHINWQDKENLVISSVHSEKKRLIKFNIQQTRTKRKHPWSHESVNQTPPANTVHWGRCLLPPSNGVLSKEVKKGKKNIVERIGREKTKRSLLADDTKKKKSIKGTQKELSDLIREFTRLLQTKSVHKSHCVSIYRQRNQKMNFLKR